MNSERAEFDRAIANLYGFKQLRLTPEYVVPARKHYPYLREQTAAFIAANSHRLSPLELQLLEANARLEGPLYSAFRDLLWARYQEVVRARPDLPELVAACVRLGWWKEFSALRCDLSARAWRDLIGLGRGGEHYRRMLALVTNFVQECTPYQLAHMGMEDEAKARGFRRDDPERRQGLWALNALGLRGPPVRVPPPPYANEYDVVMRGHY